VVDEPDRTAKRGVKRRTDVVGIFPNTDALLRLSECVLIEAHDEWQDSDRRYLSEESMALLNPAAPTVLEPQNTARSEMTHTISTRCGIAARPHAEQHANEFHHAMGTRSQAAFTVSSCRVAEQLG
jgi:hypothetical protein